MMKNLFIFIVLVLVIAGYLVSQTGKDESVTLSQQEIENLQGKQILFRTTHGNFTIELYAKDSPITVSNFINYIKSNFYSETIFHRMIPGIIIQGGGYLSDMKVKQTLSGIKNESNNGISNLKGTIAMARRGGPDTAKSQFYINLRDNLNLDYVETKQGYTVFGKVVDGLTLLESLAKSKTRTEGIHKSIPINEIKVLSAKLIMKPQLIEIEGEAIQSATQDKFVEGIHYVRLKKPLELTATNKIEVISAFSFGCGHCYGVFPMTEKWSQKHRESISFSYFHAVWNKAMRMYARSYYSAIELGVENKIHMPMFEAIVINQQQLTSRDEIATFLENYGVDSKNFIKVFDSPSTTKRVEQAELLTKKFNLASVPEFIVAGKYRIDPMRAGGQEKIFDVLDFLIERERK